MAALIATGGLYAMISYVQTPRMRELGVRVALGASRRHIAATVLRHGLRVTTIGIATGFALSLAVRRVLTSAIPGLANSGWVLAAVAGVLVALPMLACWIPVRRALAVDPLTALRSE